MVTPSILHEDCPFNYEVSPGSMEGSGIMWMMERFHIIMGVCVYYQHVGNDDDNTMMKYLTHPETRSIGKKMLIDVYLKRCLYLRGLTIQSIVPSML